MACRPSSLAWCFFFLATNRFINSRPLNILISIGIGFEVTTSRSELREPTASYISAYRS